MVFVIAAIGIFLLVVGVALIVYRNQQLHHDACSDNHIAELLLTIQKLREELLEKLEEHDAFNAESLRKLEQKDRIVIGYTNKHLILTYLVATHPDNSIVHHISMSWSQKKLPIKTAAYLSAVLVYAFQKEEEWDKELRVANKKTQVFHFFLRDQNTEEAAFLRKELRALSSIEEHKDDIRNLSLEVQVERKQDQSELES